MPHSQLINVAGKDEAAAVLLVGEHNQNRRRSSAAWVANADRDGYSVLTELCVFSSAPRPFDERPSTAENNIPTDSPTQALSYG
jgi:hypothetical protein